MPTTPELTKEPQVENKVSPVILSVAEKSKEP
jgi:hypothetical protein